MCVCVCVYVCVQMPELVTNIKLWQCKVLSVFKAGMSDVSSNSRGVK